MQKISQILRLIITKYRLSLAVAVAYIICNLLYLGMVYRNLHVEFGVSNIYINWDISVHTDMTTLNLICVVYELITTLMPILCLYRI